MRNFQLMLWLLLMVLVACFGVACSSKDERSEINQLVQENKVAEAKAKYKAVIAKENDPNLAREFIKFLYQKEQFRDFQSEAKDYLSKYPEDKEIAGLQYEYYGKLATNAENQKNFEDAMYYIVNFLLSPEYPEYRKWESRQTTVLKKWFEHAKEQKNLDLQRKVLIQMKNLNFENLAKTLAPDLYAELEQQPDAGGK